MDDKRIAFQFPVEIWKKYAPADVPGPTLA